MEKFIIEMSNATLTTIAGFQAKDADLTITINRRELEDVMIGTSSWRPKSPLGRPRLVGNPQVLSQLASTMVKFTTGSRFFRVPRPKSLSNPRSKCS